MKNCLTILVLLTTVTAFGQGHNSPIGDGMKKILFLEGSWQGSQNFNTGGDPLVGKITNQISEAVGGRYLEETLATTMPGRKPTDSRHFITFDPKSNRYLAYWFNDSSIGAMELQGELVSGKLVFESKASSKPGPVFRATYNPAKPNSLEYKLELKSPAGWQLLFTSSYTK